MQAGRHLGRSWGLRARQGGFAFVWVLMTLAIFSLGMAIVGPRWSDDALRDRERELVRVGSLYAQAIAAYRAASPGSIKTYPAKLENLTSDDRMVSMTRHLRKLYVDPLDPGRPWGLVRGADGTIRGVYSQADGKPMNIERVDLGWLALPAAQRYADWKFVPKMPE